MNSINNSPNKVILVIKTPKIVSNSLSKFEALFSDLHRILKDQKNLNPLEKTIALEIVLKENYFHYRIIVSPKISEVIKSLIFSQFPDAEIEEDVQREDIGGKMYEIAEFLLKRSNLFPLRTEFAINDDPYLVISAILSKLEHFNEGIVMQLTLYAKRDPWLKKFMRENFSFIIAATNAIKLFFEKPFLVREHINSREEIYKKFSKPFFLANFRVLAYADDASSLKEDLALMLKAIEKFKNGDVNSLKRIKSKKENLLKTFMARESSSKKMILNTQEVAVMFHFPDTTLKIDTVYHVRSKKVEPPRELPLGGFLQMPNISIFGMTTSKGNKLEFGIKRIDRSRHLYIIGKTGMGKSRLIELLTLSDIHEDKGFCVIDAHGDLASDILRSIPQRRIPDVIYFNPPDAEYPIGFNPLECFSPEDKHQVVTGFVAIFKKLFAANWTNRLEHVLRFTVLALIEAGDATIVDIVKLLTDTSFRQGVIKRIGDPVVKNFWTHEFSSWNERFDNEAIIPIINQIGQFLSNDYIRNVVGQKKSRIDFYESMNSGKIIIINLAKGKLGENNASLLGSMIITKIQEAAMARVNIPQEERREFYLYVDEFQNFATESFNQILSEARKFNLSLTIAHQYIDQLTESIRKTAFGNVGSLICFRVGSEDAHFLSKEFAPRFTPEDLINLDFRQMYVKLSIDGKTSEPFSGVTLDVPELKENFEEEIIAYSRKQYAVSKKDVEKELFGENKETMTHIAKEKTYESNDDAFEEPLVN